MLVASLVGLALAATPVQVQAAATPAQAPTTLTRGAPLSGKSPKVALSEVLKKPEAAQGKVSTFDGFVRKACKKKGCWMELAESADDKSPALRVTFKDYGFFVPTDSQGSRAIVEGTVEIASLEPEKAKHLEEEGAKVDRGPDGTAREVRIVATGVELRGVAPR